PEPEPEPAEPAPEAVAEVVDLPWEEPITEPAPATAEPDPAPVPQAAEPAHDEPPFDPSAYSPAGMDRDDEPPMDEDYYIGDSDPVGFSYLDELAEHVQEEPPVAAPEPLPAAKPATGLALQWLELFPQLPVSGMTGNIAANCTLMAADGDDWLLHLDPGQGALFNATQQRRLNEALNQHLGRTLNLRIELILPEQETPAQAAARKRAERQQDAVASIEQDPLIQQMIKQFGATVRQDTIEPVEALVSQGQ
ncbi:MAG: DNA polymerase III subunit gamma/tau, partial [Pseudomonas putida]